MMKLRKRVVLAVAVSAASVIAGVAPLAEVVAFPEPAVVSPSWNLDFEHGKPTPVAVKDAAGQTRWFWYLPYKVTNNTSDDQLFIPEVTIATDRGQIVRAGQDVSATVFEQIKKNLNNPLLESPIEVVGRILQGQDYAKESVVIWPHFRGEDADEMTIFFAGLSGESQTIPNPSTGEPVLVRRTTAITYGLPGNYPTPQNAPVVPKDERDVMR